MLLTCHFTFLHVPRTGGNFVRLVLEQHAPPAWELRRHTDHATVDEIPPDHAVAPRFAFVRNPIDGYVSWYHFQQRTRDPFFLEISAGGTLSFAATMRRMLVSRPALQYGDGPYTQLLRSLLGPGLVGVRIGRFERIRADLLRLLSECVEVPAALQAAIRDESPTNRSDHREWQRYYDDELREIVAAKDRDALQFFGYSWQP